MNHRQVQEDITIIKNMIEKTKKGTASSAPGFIFLGIALAVGGLTIGILEFCGLHRWVLPVMIALTVITGISGYCIIGRAAKKEKIVSYPKTIILNLWMICFLTLLLVAFVFPFLRIFPFKAGGTIASLILGIAVYMSGVIYEMRSIQLLSAVWWIGAILMAALQGYFLFWIMIANIIIGWIVPGIILQKQQKNRSDGDEA